MLVAHSTLSARSPRLIGKVHVSASRPECRSGSACCLCRARRFARLLSAMSAPSPVSSSTSVSSAAGSLSVSASERQQQLLRSLEARCDAGRTAHLLRLLSLHCFTLCVRRPGNSLTAAERQCVERCVDDTTAVHALVAELIAAAAE